MPQLLKWYRRAQLHSGQHLTCTGGCALGCSSWVGMNAFNCVCAQHELLQKEVGKQAESRHVGARKGCAPCLACHAARQRAPHGVGMPAACLQPPHAHATMKMGMSGCKACKNAKTREGDHRKRILTVLVPGPGVSKPLNTQKHRWLGAWGREYGCALIRQNSDGTAFNSASC